MSWSKIDSDYGDDNNLNKIKTDYGDNKNLNQVKTNYGNNKDDIQIETNYNNNEDSFEIETNYSNNVEMILLEATACLILLLPHLHLTNDLDLGNDIASMAEFDMMQSSLPANPIAVGLNFLISATNLKYGSTLDIFPRMSEVSQIC